MRLSRLWSMGPEAVADRVRQEVMKRMERARLAPVALDEIEVAHQVDRLRAGVVRFIPGALDPETPAAVAARFPVERERLLAAAERIVARRFNLLGYRGLEFGAPLDWSLDPVSGKKSPPAHWSVLDPLDAAVHGDAKVVWELGRHQWLVTLAQAWAIGRDPRHARTALALLDDWLARNPPGVGIHWTSSLEAALRIISWSWALVLLAGAPGLDEVRLRRLVAALAAHAVRVERYLSLHYSPNTHLTGEALGLVYAGTILDGLAAAPRWRRLGDAILARELARQVLPDGVYFEQATCYQRYTVEFLLHWRLLGGGGEQLPALTDFLLHIRRPDGSMPSIGDADGGWLLPLAERAPDDLRGVFSTVAALLGDRELAWAAGGLQPETMWLLGPDAALPSPVAPRRPRSRFYPQGGWAILGDHWGADGSQAILDVGPLGCPHSGGHGHADLLAVQLAFKGEALVVDPGTGSYADPKWRAHFRSTAAHSALVVDGRGQAETTGPFSWRERPVTERASWITRPDFDLAAGEHHAWAPLRHRRTVIMHRGKRLRVIVIDDLSGPGEHDVELGFQLAPGATVALRGGSVRVSSAGGVCADVVVRAPNTRARVVDAWVSPDYGQIVPAPRLAFSTRARFPLRLVTVWTCVESQES